MANSPAVFDPQQLQKLKTGSPSGAGFASTFLLDDDDRQTRTPWWSWLIFLLIAVLFHTLLFFFEPGVFSPAPPAPVEIHQIDPAKLDAIKKQWKRENQDMPLLLNKDKSLPKDKEASPDARYMSDRNIRVEKEQRASKTNVIPTPPSDGARAQPKTEAKKKGQRLSNLGALGVPFHLAGDNAPAREREQERDQGRGQTQTPEGGDQAILDKNIPEGSENLLNTQESIYYSFYARIYETIGPIWQSEVRKVPYARKIPEGTYSTVVDVVLDAQGNILEVRRIDGSGIVEFDEAVNIAWGKVGPFPNPPTPLLAAQRRIHTGWTFTVQVGAGFNLQYAPPERNY